MFLFLTSSVFSHYFHFVSLRFIICFACVVDPARHGHILKAATLGQPAGTNIEKGGEYSKTFLNKDVELRA